MGPEDKIEITESEPLVKGEIPGLDLDSNDLSDKRDDKKEKKVPYSKPIPRNFQAQWNDTGRPDDNEDTSKEIKDVITQIVEKTPKKKTPSAMVVLGQTVKIIRK